MQTDRGTTREPRRTTSAKNCIKLGTGMEDYLLSRGKAEEKIVQQSVVFTDRDEVLDLTPLPDISAKRKSDSSRTVSDRFSYCNRNKEDKKRLQRKLVAQRTKEYAQRFRKKNVIKKEIVLLTNAKYVAKAIRIQMWWRVVKYKKHIKSIIDIQRVWRGCMGRIKAQVFRNCLTRFQYLSDAVFAFWRQKTDLQKVFHRLKNFRTDKQALNYFSFSSNIGRSRFKKSLSQYLSYSERAQKKQRSRATIRSCSPRMRSFHQLSDFSNNFEDSNLKFSPSLSYLQKHQEVLSEQEELKSQEKMYLLAPQESHFPATLSPPLSKSEVEKSAKEFQPLSDLQQSEEQRKEGYSRFPEIMSPESGNQFEIPHSARGEDDLMSNQFSHSSPVQPRKPIYYYGMLEKKDEDDSNVFVLSNDSETSRRKEQVTVDVNELGSLVMKLYEQNQKLVRAFQGTKEAAESASQNNIASLSNSLYQRILKNWREGASHRDIRSPSSFEGGPPQRLEESEHCVNDIIQLLTNLSEENEQLLRRIDHLEIPESQRQQLRRELDPANLVQQAFKESEIQSLSKIPSEKSRTNLRKIQSGEDLYSLREECPHCRRMREKVNELSGSVQVLERKLRAVKENNIKTQREYLELQEIHARLKTNLNKTAAGYLKGLEQEIRNIRKVNQNLKEGAQKYTKDVEKQKERLCRRIEKLRGEKDKAEDDLSQLKIDQARESRDQREQIQNLEQEVAEQRRAKERAEKRELQLQQEVKSERKRLETDLRNLSQDLERKHNDNSKYEEQMNYELKMNMVEKSKVELELRETKAEVERKQVEIDDLRSQFAKDIRERESAREKLEVIAQEAIELNQKSSQEITKRDQAVKLKQKELERLRLEIKDTQDKAQNIQRQNVNLKNKCEAELRDKERQAMESAKIRDTQKEEKEKLQLENLHLKNEISQNRIELMNQVKTHSDELDKWKRKITQKEKEQENEQKYFAVKIKEISQDYDIKITQIQAKLDDAHLKLAHSLKHEDLVLQSQNAARNIHILQEEREEQALRELRLRYGRSFSLTSLRDLRRGLFIEHRVRQNQLQEQVDEQSSQLHEELKQDVGVGQSPPALSEVVSEVRSCHSSALDHYQKNIHLIIKMQRMFRDKLLKRWIEEKEAREHMDRSMRKKECFIF